VVPLEGGENTKKYRYTVMFFSDLDETKKDAVVKKIQDTLKPHVADGTIQATSDAIHVDIIDVGETYPIVST